MILKFSFYQEMSRTTCQYLIGGDPRLKVVAPHEPSVRFRPVLDTSDVFIAKHDPTPSFYRRLLVRVLIGKSHSFMFHDIWCTVACDVGGGWEGGQVFFFQICYGNPCVLIHVAITYMQLRNFLWVSRDWFSLGNNIAWEAVSCYHQASDVSLRS